MKTLRDYINLVDDVEQLSEMAAKTKFDYTVEVQEAVNGKSVLYAPVINTFTVQAEDSYAASSLALKQVAQKYNTSFNTVDSIQISKDKKYLVKVSIQMSPHVRSILLRRAKTNWGSYDHIAKVYLRAKNVWLLTKYRREETHILNVADEIDSPAHEQFLRLINN
jgi:hypothetical protein